MELPFHEGLVKALLAIKIFAMGLSMPIKTIVFTSIRKWDGDSHRIIRSSEYIQMSGRAGRCGKDERGICIIRNDEQMEMNTLKDMVLGKPTPLISTFRLSYCSILNMMYRADGQFTAEHVIRNSFYQFQYEKEELVEYHKLILDIAQLEKKMMSEIIRPERVLYFLLLSGLLQKFCNELKSRLRVLKKLGHIDADGVVQLKGWTTCLIDTGDELLITEQMFNGTFNDLDHHQVAALASCFIPGEKSNEQIHLRTELGKPLLQLQESTRRIAEIQRECKLEVNVEEYVESTVIIFFKDVIYCWPKGATFAEVIEMTDRFEGSIMPLSRRLDEFLNQLRAAAGAMGDVYFESKFATSSESLRKGMFANLLYQ
ncbi:hypothetical protein GIB67_040641 [Kingdonia uniflora]|uniref:Helicase C-terminal domain-containing protein n=1 Tax=Kingdonia uniflora TaxID=39325 RepID=A0A7J7M9E8_9MAGN|nr:hypothetical protein GIB67_040641 [Kingdonia uniflora]